MGENHRNSYLDSGSELEFKSEPFLPNSIARNPKFSTAELLSATLFTPTEPQTETLAVNIQQLIRIPKQLFWNGKVKERKTEEREIENYLRRRHGETKLR